jgi:3,4-dihydroxy-2-butanone 4-phosphate synthase
MVISSIEEAIKDIKEGKFVIIVDDEDREKRGRPGDSGGKGNH